MFFNQKSKISIILPTFNSENYLQDTLQSILNQNYKNYELIIIDNVSIDNTINIINSYKKKLHLKLIQKKTKNLAEALNIGINESSGEFIARIDADDIVRKKRFSKQVAFLKRNIDYDIVGTNAFRFKNNIFFVKPFLIDYEDIFLKISMIFNSPFIHPSIMVRKKFIDNNYINYNHKFDECEDYELWLKIVKKTKFKNLKYHGIYYRVHSQSASFKKREKLNEFFEISNRKYLSDLNINLSNNEYDILRKVSLLMINNNDDYDDLNSNYIKVLQKIEEALIQEHNKDLINNFLKKKYLRFCLRSINTCHFHPRKIRNIYFKINKIYLLIIYLLYLFKIRL